MLEEESQEALEKGSQDYDWKLIDETQLQVSGSCIMDMHTFYRSSAWNTWPRNQIKPVWNIPTESFGLGGHFQGGVHCQGILQTAISATC